MWTFLPFVPLEFCRIIVVVVATDAVDVRFNSFVIQPSVLATKDKRGDTNKSKNNNNNNIKKGKRKDETSRQYYSKCV